MKKKVFRKLIIELYGEILEPHGFTLEKPSSDMFYRKISEEVYHFLTYDLSGGGHTYSVWMFPSSPIFYLPGQFEKKFPDDIGIPSWHPYLEKNKRGGGAYSFNSETEDEFFGDFERYVKPGLINVALPYLDNMQTINDMVPFLGHGGLSLGLALHYLDRKKEAIEPLKNWYKRFYRSDNKYCDNGARNYVEFVQKIIQECEEAK